MPAAGATLTPDVVLAHCTARLSAHKRPKHVQIVADLPKSHYGKVQRGRVRAAAIEHRAAGGGRAPTAS